MSDRLTSRVEAVLWERHSNPMSGWSRVPTGPVLVYALYRRDWRLLSLGLLWAAVNPVVFSPPESRDAWMTRAVLAERWWIRQRGNRTVGPGYPNVLNLGGALAFLCALAAAWRRRPAGTGVATVLAVGLKLLWLRAIVHRYDARAE